MAKITVNSSAKHSTATHQMVQKSKILNRRYVKRPTSSATKVTTHTATITPKTATNIVATKTVEKATVPKASHISPAHKTNPQAETPRITSFRKQSILRSAEKPTIAKSSTITKRSAHPHKAPTASSKVVVPTQKTSAGQMQRAIAARRAAEAATQAALTTAPKPIRAKTTPATHTAPTAKAIISSESGKQPIIDKQDRDIKQAAKVATKSIESTKKPSAKIKRHTGRKVVLALMGSAVTVAALAFFVKINMPDLTVRVAAMQTGIEASYPTYIPNGYSLGDVESNKDGLITMNFSNTNDESFVLTEENSSWDSRALQSNFVKDNFETDYITMREQGITIYIDHSNAAWVNGGILHKLTFKSNSLSKEQVKNIATSM